MSHLVMDSSTDVQKMAYHFLEGAAKKRTEHFVIEAGVDAEATVKADLPSEILDILQRIIILDEEPKPQVGLHSLSACSAYTVPTVHFWILARLDAAFRSF